MANKEKKFVKNEKKQKGSFKKAGKAPTEYQLTRDAAAKHAHHRKRTE